jgi:hypothetical protein
MQVGCDVTSSLSVEACLQGGRALELDLRFPRKNSVKSILFWNMNPVARPHECSLGPPPCHAGGPLDGAGP